MLHSSRLGVGVKASSSVPQAVRFGVFELDPRAGELRKKGMKIRLRGQPVEILAMLLERPGETITLEELKKKLWLADTFVDFEQGLNNASEWAEDRAGLGSERNRHGIFRLPIRAARAETFSLVAGLGRTQSAVPHARGGSNLEAAL